MYYAIANKYLRVVDITEKVTFGLYPRKQLEIVPKEKFSTEDFLNLLDVQQELLIFDNLVAAQVTAIFFTRLYSGKYDKNKYELLVPPYVKQFSSVVIFEFDQNLDLESSPSAEVLHPGILSRYMDFKTALFYACLSQEAEREYAKNVLSAFNAYSKYAQSKEEKEWKLPKYELHRLSVLPSAVYFHNATCDNFIRQPTPTAKIFQFPGQAASKKPQPRI